MTRINTLDVKLLTDQHLMAEYRELPMVHGSLKRTLASKKGLDRTKEITEYRLNKGHVYSFYFRGAFLYDRYNNLIDELRLRGFKLKPGERDVDWNVFRKNGLWKDWQPTKADDLINIERIRARILDKPVWYQYYGRSLHRNRKILELYDLSHNLFGK